MRTSNTTRGRRGTLSPLARLAACLLVGAVLAACTGRGNDSAEQESDPCRLYTKAELGRFGNVPPEERETRMLARFREAGVVDITGIQYCSYSPFIVGLVSSTPKYARASVETWRRDTEEHHPVVPVKGVGDAAYWDENFSVLVVLDDDAVLAVYTKEAPAKDRAVKLAAKGLERQLEPVNDVIDPT